MAVHFFRVLESEAQQYIAAGWTEAARDHIPSVSEDIVVLEWAGGGEPVMPARGDG